MNKFQAHCTGNNLFTGPATPAHPRDVLGAWRARSVVIVYVSDYKRVRKLGRKQISTSPSTPDGTQLNGLTGADVLRTTFTADGRNPRAPRTLVGSTTAFRPGESRPDNHLTVGEPAEHLITFRARNTTRSA